MKNKRNVFRGISKETNKMVYGSLVENKKGRSYIIFDNWATDDSDVVTEVFPETVGQCTGFVDKNGKYIFEGDYLKFGDRSGKVIFDYGSFRIRQYINGEVIDSTFEPTLALFNIKVIGNIFEIPKQNENMIKYYIEICSNKGRLTDYGFLGPVPKNSHNPKRCKMMEFASHEEWYDYINDYFKEES